MINMERILNYILSRLHESTTWAGIFAIAATLGLDLTSEQSIAIGGLIMVLLPNKIDLNSDNKFE